MRSGSAIFRPYKGLGLFSSDVPFIVKYKTHSKEYNIAVPVGERFNVYKLPNLKFCGISDCLPEDIICFSSDRVYAYASAGNVIYAFRGLRNVAFKLEGHKACIRKLVVFNQFYLASYDDDGVFMVWDLKKRESVCETTFDETTFELSAMCQPTGYGDKLLLGSKQGPLQLWKTSKNKSIFWFRGFDSSVTCLSQSPAIDVIAIGLGNGQVILHNLRYDTTLVSVAQQGGAVTAIEFRSDSIGLGASDVLHSAGIDNRVSPDTSIYLLAGSASGQLAIWELEEGRCRAVNQSEDFHLARVTSLFCIPSGEAAGALVSNGADNCIKVSFFDRPDAVPRMGHVRSGHFLPPNKIAFWTGGSAGGNLLISGGPDSQLRIFSTFNERYDRSLGRAYSPAMPLAKRLSTAQRLPFLLPGPSAIALSPGRAHDWDSVAVAHTNRREVTTWNFVRATRGKHWLDPQRFHGRGGDALRVHRHTVATCLCLTRCGHFVVIGYSSGDVVKFNIQSGREYGGFGDPGKAHESGIVGVHVTTVNRLLITVGTDEVKFWNFIDAKHIDTLRLEAAASFSKFHDESDALAVALTTGEIILINAINRGIFRRLQNPENHPCSDLTLSSDGTLMVTAHRGDPLIKTWDIVDCKLLDCFRVRQPATSIAFSPADDMLATTHLGCLGVYLWDNKATYQRLHLKPLPTDYTPPKETVELPTEGLTTKMELDSDAEEMEEEPMEDEEDKVSQPPEYLSPVQLQDRLATLSGLPPTFFSSFLQLDAIKKRNAEAMRANDDDGVPPQLPFFLPAIETTTGLAWVDDDEDENEGEEDLKGEERAADGVSKRKRKRERKALDLEASMFNAGNSILSSFLGESNSLDATDNAKCDEVMAALKRLTPSALDGEIRGMAPSRDELTDIFEALNTEVAEDANGNAFLLTSNPYARLSAFLCLLLNRFRRNLDVDFATACLESLLRFHGDLIACPPKVPEVKRRLIIDVDAEDEIDAADVLGDVLEEVGEEEETNNAHRGGFHARLDSVRPLELVEAVLDAKRVAHSTLNMQISRSIALVDFVRNATRL